MTDLRSAEVAGPRAADHVRGPDTAPLVLFSGDFACPKCALAPERLRSAPVRVAYRHFALKAKHPWALALAHACEAAGRQGRFWELADALYADQGRLEDPHLWAPCAALGLALARGPPPLGPVGGARPRPRALRPRPPRRRGRRAREARRARRVARRRDGDPDG